MIESRATTLAITINGAVREVLAPCSVAGLLGLLELRPQQVAVEVNRVIVPRSRHEAHQLAPGDAVEIVTLVGGG
jgi:thiamine biosynthesis protein ThiS